MLPFSPPPSLHFLSPTAEVVIGFERIMYVTNESSSQVVVVVRVREGELGRTVMLGLRTMDGSALSKSLQSVALLVIGLGV